MKTTDFQVCCRDLPLTCLSIKQEHVGTLNTTLSLLGQALVSLSIRAPVNKAKIMQPRIVYFKAACKLSGDFLKH